MKYTRHIVAAGALATAVATAVALTPKAHSADHLDSPKASADATADINDLYAWMDTTNFVMVMTVNPAATAASKFSDAVQYAFHTTSGTAFGNAEGGLVDVICTFDAAQKIQCWAGKDEYVTGDASATTGLTSKSGKFKVFAGRRADPFFFNLDGFKETVKIVKGAAGGLSFDAAKCPALNAATSTLLVNQLKTAPGGGAPVDAFKEFDALAIVVSLDKTLINKGGAIVSASASTHKKN
jgi:Domain of unknown function (DUF4331)